MDWINEITLFIEKSVLVPGLDSTIWFFLFALLSEVVAPIPSTVVFAGPLLMLGDGLSLVLFIKLLFYVAIPISLGMTIGSYVFYGIAYWGGKPAIERLKKYLKFSWSDVERLESKFENNWYDEAVFIFLRLIPLAPNTPLNIIAGLLRMNFASYSILTFIGLLIKSIIMILLFSLGGAGMAKFFNL